MQKYYQIEKIKEQNIIVVDGELNEIVIENIDECNKYNIGDYVFLEEDRCQNSKLIIDNTIDNNSNIFINSWKSYIMKKANSGILYTGGFKRLSEINKNPNATKDIKYFFEFAIKRARLKANNLIKLSNKKFVNNLQYYVLILDNEPISIESLKRKVVDNLLIDYMIMSSKSDPTKLYIKSFENEYLNLDSLMELMRNFYEADKQEEAEEIRVGKKLSEKDLEVFKRMMDIIEKEGMNYKNSFIKEKQLEIFEYLEEEEKMELEKNVKKYIYEIILLYFEINREVKKDNLEKISTKLKELNRKKLAENFMERQRKEAIFTENYEKLVFVDYLSKENAFLDDLSVYIDVKIHNIFTDIAEKKGYYGYKFIGGICPPIVLERSKQILLYNERRGYCMMLFYTFRKYGEERFNAYLATFGFESLKRYQELSDGEIHQILQFIECDEINNGFVFEEYLTYN